MQSPHQMRQERFALAGWIADGGYTHALTLNTDRELTAARIQKVFSAFCHMFDKTVFKHRNMRSMPRDLRLRAIAFPENLSTNAHLHVVADFTEAVQALGDENKVLNLARTCWLKATRGAGSFHSEPAPDRGWASYCTKRYNGTYFLSADFFPA